MDRAGAMVFWPLVMLSRTDFWVSFFNDERVAFPSKIIFNVVCFGSGSMNLLYYFVYLCCIIGFTYLQF